MRLLAFEAIRSLVASGAMQLQMESFIHVPGTYPSWEDFEARFLRVTHTKHSIDAQRYQEIREAFMSHMGEEGAHFLKPHRIDLLRKPSD
jgi:hypothetical protein